MDRDPPMIRIGPTVGSLLQFLIERERQTPKPTHNPNAKR